MMNGWWWQGMYHGTGLLVGCLLFLLVLAAVVMAVWLLARLAGPRPGAAQTAPAPPQAAGPDPVLETLRRRLAEGAITTQEYDELRNKLGV